MSSLAAARADNFYFPPEWTPAMGGLSKFQGSKGANQYQQFGIVRYELPFDAWCLKCERHICKGHRFNAKKDKIGKYFTTILYSFTTKCPSCDQQFVIKTDPENRTYDFAEGLRKMVQDFTPDANDSIIETTSDETKALLTTDPMYRLQHDKVGKIKADSARDTLERLIDVQETQFKNDFAMNSLLRQKLRAGKQKRNEMLEAGKAVGLSIPLVDPSEAHLIEASRASFRPTKPNSFQARERVKFAEIIGGSIFDNSKRSASSSSGSKISMRSGQSKRALDDESNSSIHQKGENNVTSGLKDDHLGSQAKRARRELDAMKRQAVVKIDTKCFTMKTVGKDTHTSPAVLSHIIAKKNHHAEIEVVEPCGILKQNGQNNKKYELLFADYDSD